MSKVDDFELKYVAEISAAAEVESNAGQLIHDWKIEQVAKITTEVIPKYKTQFEAEIKHQKNGEKIAESFVSETMIQFIATVMTNIAFTPICEKISTLSSTISKLTIDNHKINEPYPVLSPGNKVVVDIDTFFNTAKIDMATSLLTELEKLSPKKPKNKKQDDVCVISGGSKRRKSNKSKKSMNKKKSKKIRKIRIIRRTRKSRV
jgi:hypothetical protein